MENVDHLGSANWGWRFTFSHVRRQLARGFINVVTIFGPIGDSHVERHDGLLVETAPDEPSIDNDGSETLACPEC